MKLAIKAMTGTLMLLAVSAMAEGEGRRGFGGPGGRGEHREPPAEVKAAFQACATEAGVTVTEGQRPRLSEEQRHQVGACMEAKGIQPPPRGDRGGRGNHEGFEKMKACVADLGVEMPEHQPGVRPELSDVQKAALDTCRQKLRSEKEAEGSVVSSASNTGVVSSSAQ